MTTVACSMKTHSMAADSMCNQGDVAFTVRKIIRLPEGAGLLGTAGSRYLTGLFEASFRGGVYDIQKPEAPEGEGDFEAIWLRPDGIWVFDCSFYPEVVGEVAAIGTGGKTAMSHMLDDLTPEEAVRRACRVDVNSREPVYVEFLENACARNKSKSRTAPSRS